MGARTNAWDWLLDRSILFSFDRHGFERHRRGFAPDDLSVDLHGKVALVTGAASGLGLATARALATLGATTYLLVRTTEKGEAARRLILEAAPGADVRVEPIDVARLASVEAFAQRFTEPVVDVLVNNAGVLPDARTLTEDGLELTWATNVVGPFLLTALLLPRLRRAADARVINVSSGGMLAERLDLDLVGFEGRPFDGVVAYAQTKRAEVILTEQWAERLRGSNITVSAMHPGWADTPAVKTSLPRFHRVTKQILRTPEQGADTIVWLAASPRAAGRSGLFWFDRAPAEVHLLERTRERPEDRARLWALLLAQIRSVVPALPELEAKIDVAPTPERPNKEGEAKS